MTRFKPFSLKSAFSLDEDSTTTSTTVPDASNTIIMSSSSSPTTSSPIEESIGLIVVEDQVHHTSSCGCRSCGGRVRKSMDPYEQLNKKMDWILTIVIFMFIVLIIHVRSQQSNSKL